MRPFKCSVTSWSSAIAVEKRGISQPFAKKRKFRRRSWTRNWIVTQSTCTRLKTKHVSSASKRDTMQSTVLRMRSTNPSSRRPCWRRWLVRSISKWSLTLTSAAILACPTQKCAHIINQLSQSSRRRCRIMRASSKRHRSGSLKIAFLKRRSAMVARSKVHSTGSKARSQELLLSLITT